MYGVFERQFRRYFEGAQRREGLTGVNLLVVLETPARQRGLSVWALRIRAPQARQLVRHGHFDVNGSKVNIPSYSGASPVTWYRARRQPSQWYFQDLAEDLDAAQVRAG